MSKEIQVPMPGVGWSYGMEPGRAYTTKEYLSLIEPRYNAYKEQIRRCISGLTAYAAQHAANHQDAQLPMLRGLIMEMALYWNLDGGLDKASDERMKRQYGGAFDRAVAEARQSSQFSQLTDQARQDVLTGLEVHVQELSDNAGPEAWIQKNDKFAQQLRAEWQMGLEPEQQGVLTITMGGMSL